MCSTIKSLNTREQEINLWSLQYIVCCQYSDHDLQFCDLQEVNVATVVTVAFVTSSIEGLASFKQLALMNAQAWLDTKIKRQMVQVPTHSPNRNPVQY